MPPQQRVRVLIIGSGPAGCTAAIYAARASLEPLMLRGLQPGGQLTITTEVENYPGAYPAVQGPALMETMEAQAAHCGARLEHDLVTEADFSRRPYVCKGDSGVDYVADSVIIATGAQAKWLGLESESRLQGRGVSGCATCDGFFFRGKDVLVVGGGNTAVEEALYLSGLCGSVTVVHRRGGFRAEPVLRDRLRARPNVRVLFDTEVVEILGSGSVHGARVRGVDTGIVSEFPCGGVFVAIGHAPATAAFRGQVDLNGAGYVRTAPGSTQALRDGAPLPGVFAAGDVADDRYRQAVTAAAMGCMSALDAQRFLESGS
jgi:thioredoxin reductase (NADPH)